jgi:hypothetical protein
VSVCVDEIEEEEGFRLIYNVCVCVCVCVCVYVVSVALSAGGFVGGGSRPVCVCVCVCMYVCG